MINKYDSLDQKALQIIMDYSDAHFPLDLGKLCEKLRIKLIPYSTISKEKMNEISAIAKNGELKDGCSILLKHPDDEGYLAYTYYNDNSNDIYVAERIHYTIGHEIKHVVYNETDPTDEQESDAEHFSRALLAPCCVLIAGNYNKYEEIMEKFKITESASKNALAGKNNRMKKYGDTYFDYERDFMDWFLENLIE